MLTVENLIEIKCNDWIQVRTFIQRARENGEKVDLYLSLWVYE